MNERQFRVIRLEQASHMENTHHAISLKTPIVHYVRVGGSSPRSPFPSHIYINNAPPPMIPPSTTIQFQPNPPTEISR